MGKPELKPRVVAVSGYLVFEPSDPGYMWSIAEVSNSLGGLDELTVTELPNATVTPHGVRTDL